MLKALSLKLEHWLPFLQLHSWPGDHPATGGQPPAPPLASWLPGGDYSGAEQLQAQRENASLTELKLFGALLDGLSLKDCDLSHAQLLSSRVHQGHFERVTLTHALLSAIDAEGLRLLRSDLSHTTLTGTSLREAWLEDLDLREARLHLCDGFGSHWTRVRADSALLSVVDLSFSTLETVDFSGADLRGCRFYQALCQNVTLEGARVLGADFRGVRGLTPEQLQALRLGGARLGDPWLKRRLLQTLSRLQPERSLQSRETLAQRLSLSIQALIFVLLVAGCIQLFWRGPYQPEAHGVPEASEAASAARPPREPTAEEVQKTRENLEKLRAALKAAYDATARYGVARYPTQEELANNEFDRDGNGPGTDKLPLMAGGIPGNFLTGGEGVSPYCNPSPTQGTLTGDDTDWHYCEETGRVYACGGFTTAPTLSW